LPEAKKLEKAMSTLVLFLLASLVLYILARATNNYAGINAATPGRTMLAMLAFSFSNYLLLNLFAVGVLAVFGQVLAGAPGLILPILIAIVAGANAASLALMRYLMPDAVHAKNGMALLVASGLLTGVMLFLPI